MTTQAVVSIHPDVDVLVNSQVTRGAYRYKSLQRTVEVWLELQAKSGTERSTSRDKYEIVVTFTDDTTVTLFEVRHPGLYMGIETALTTSARWFAMTRDGLRGIALTSGQQPFGTGVDSVSNFQDTIFAIAGTKIVKWIDIVWTND